MMPLPLRTDRCIQVSGYVTNCLTAKGSPGSVRVDTLTVIVSLAGMYLISRNTAGSTDTIVIGGGLVGASVATGLAQASHRVTVLDGGDADFRSSRGNFGLVWVQGKGAHSVPYAQWTGAAAKAWPGFAAELLDSTGVDVQLQQTGGIDYFLSESDFQVQATNMQRVHEHTEGMFKYQMLYNHEVRDLIPQVSEAVFGASFSPADGHVNPLKLLKALHIKMQQHGCRYIPDSPVIDIKAHSDSFEVLTKNNRFFCEKLVLAGGLANTALAEKLGMTVPLKPNQGQLLITERFKPFLTIPSIHIRQTDEGTLQIGDSHADAGFNDSTSLEVLAKICSRLLKIFPHLASVNVIRSWSALRVLTPDGLPIYERSRQWPNAYAVNCHSGVTLAAQHATVLSQWISAGSDATGDNHKGIISEFSAARFSDV